MFKGLIILWVIVFLGKEINGGMEVVVDSEKVSNNRLYIPVESKIVGIEISEYTV